MNITACQYLGPLPPRWGHNLSNGAKDLNLRDVGRLDLALRLVFVFITMGSSLGSLVRFFGLYWLPILLLKNHFVQSQTTCSPLFRSSISQQGTTAPIVPGCHRRPYSTGLLSWRLTTCADTDPENPEYFQLRMTLAPGLLHLSLIFSVSRKRGRRLWRKAGYSVCGTENDGIEAMWNYVLWIECDL